MCVFRILLLVYFVLFLNIVGSKAKYVHAPTCKMAENLGYACENHVITTEDGYILEVHRIPGGKEGLNSNNPPVLLHHGLLQSSVDWVIPGPQRGLVFLLADRGYDVWMANARGNTYSAKHEVLNSNQFRFWNWSWHEMGLYDLTADIDYILKITGRKKLQFVCFSMGCTAFFVMASLRPEYNDKLIFVNAMAPIVFTKNTVYPMSSLSAYTRFVFKLLNMITKGKFLTRSKPLEILSNLLCGISKTFNMCKTYMKLVGAYNEEQYDESIISLYARHFPAGTSSKTMAHFAQLIGSGIFRQFDYGRSGNLKKYASVTPPEYNVKLVTTPVSVYYAVNDKRSTSRDDTALYKHLVNPVGLYKVKNKLFNHSDFVIGRDVRPLVYDRVVRMIEKNKDGNANCKDRSSANYDEDLCVVETV